MNNKFVGIIRKYDYLCVAFCLIAIYFLIVLSFGYLSNLHKILFWSLDAQSYRDAGEWLLGKTSEINPITRPFFYPLLLVITQASKHDYMIWFFQVCLWLFSGVLIYWSIKTTTPKIFLAVAGVIIYASNLTLLLLTLNALTEVVTVFLITIWIAIVTHKEYLREYYWPLLLFVVGILTVTRPVFILLLFVILIYLTIFLSGIL